VMEKIGWILLSGWLLMTPSFEGYFFGQDFKWLDKAPVNQWVHEASFDTAVECQAEILVRSKLAGEMRKGLPEDKQILGIRLLERYMLSRCVPADYIYPPKN